MHQGIWKPKRECAKEFGNQRENAPKNLERPKRECFKDLEKLKRECVNRLGEAKERI